MGDVAVVVLAGVVLALGVGLVLVVLWSRAAFEGRAAADARSNELDRLRGQLERDRDDALADQVRTAAERDQARAQAAAYAESLRVAREELTKYVREKLAAGSDADVVDELDRLLGTPVSPVRPAEPPAGGDHGKPAVGTVLHP